MHTCFGFLPSRPIPYHPGCFQMGDLDKQDERYLWSGFKRRSKAEMRYKFSDMHTNTMITKTTHPGYFPEKQEQPIRVAMMSLRSAVHRSPLPLRCKNADCWCGVESCSPKDSVRPRARLLLQHVLRLGKPASCCLRLKKTLVAPLFAKKTLHESGICTAVSSRCGPRYIAPLWLAT